MTERSLFIPVTWHIIWCVIGIISTIKIVFILWLFGLVQVNGLEYLLFLLIVPFIYMYRNLIYLYLVYLARYYPCVVTIMFYLNITQRWYI